METQKDFAKLCKKNCGAEWIKIFDGDYYVNLDLYMRKKLEDDPDIIDEIIKEFEELEENDIVEYLKNGIVEKVSDEK